MNPDHDGLGSFVPSDIADGSEVQLLNSDFEADDTLYIWKDGKVVDGEGKEVDIKAKGKSKKEEDRKDSRSGGNF